MHGPSVRRKAGLEKTNVMIDRHGMWQMLRVYGIEGKLLNSLQSFFR